MPLIISLSYSHPIHLIEHALELLLLFSYVYDIVQRSHLIGSALCSCVLCALQERESPREIVNGKCFELISAAAVMLM